MPFYCPECGYRSKKRIPHVQCPACDSPAIRATGRDKGQESQSPRQRNIRLVILVALWIYLIFEIYVRLYH